MAATSALSGKLKRISFNSRLLIFPAIILAGVVACFAPELLTIPLGIALFAYFWNHKAQLVLFLIIYTGSKYAWMIMAMIKHSDTSGKIKNLPAIRSINVHSLGMSSNRSAKTKRTDKVNLTLTKIFPE